jgi:hypothetical protein
VCAPKAPKIKEPDKKPVEVLHNPLLDGTHGINGLRIGRGSLRTDLNRSGYAGPSGSGVVTPSTYSPPAGVGNPLTIGYAPRQRALPR